MQVNFIQKTFLWLVAINSCKYTVVSRKRAHGWYTLLCAQTGEWADIWNITAFYHEKVPLFTLSQPTTGYCTPTHPLSTSLIQFSVCIFQACVASHKWFQHSRKMTQVPWINFTGKLVIANQNFSKLPQWLLDIVLVPISHHFLCNYRLTCIMLTSHTRSIKIKAVMGGERIFDPGPFFARLRYGQFWKLKLYAIFHYMILLKRWLGLMKRRLLVVLEATYKRIYGQQEFGKFWCVVRSQPTSEKLSL